MTSQIFKKSIPNNLLFDFLETNSEKTDKKYIFNKNAYKKAILKDNIKLFYSKCFEYYYLSKKKYLERKISFNSLITIIRQICNYNKIIYTSQIKYEKSTYETEYYIFY